MCNMHYSFLQMKLYHLHFISFISVLYSLISHSVVLVSFKGFQLLNFCGLYVACILFYLIFVNLLTVMMLA
jgi:hypothetical protein